MMLKFYFLLGGLACVAGALFGGYFYGHHAGYQARAAQDAVVVAKAEKKAQAINAKLQLADEASQKVIQSLQSNIQSLQAAIKIVPLAGGVIHEIPVRPGCPTIANPFSSPNFRVLYDAGSSASPSPQTHSMPRAASSYLGAASAGV